MKRSVHISGHIKYRPVVESATEGAVERVRHGGQKGRARGPESKQAASGQCVKNGKGKRNTAVGFGIKTMINMRKVAGMIRRQ